MKAVMTIDSFCTEAASFAQNESNTSEPARYGVPDGKAIGTYLEHKFQRFLHEKYAYVEGSSAKGIVDDIVAFLMERHLPIDDIQAYQIAEELLTDPPRIGYLTISNALQWRLQYRRVIDLAGQVDGIRKLI